ncbi:MAG: AAA family ATPase [bacterium]|nr:AAA family ATPase [bacterium]
MTDQASKLREIVNGPKIIGFTSGKGGVGKTNIAVNIAVCLANEGLNILLLDADLSLANVDLLFGISPDFNIKDVILGNKELKDIIVNGPCNLKIIPAASGIEELADLDSEKSNKFIKAFTELENEFDFIFIDTAAGISKNVRDFLLVSDEVVIITTPELTSLADAYATIKVVTMNKNSPSIKIIVNRVKSEKQATDTVERIGLLTSKFLKLEIENFGFVYEDPAVGEAVESQRPFITAKPYSRASVCIKKIANGIKALKSRQEGAKSLFERITEVSALPIEQSISGVLPAEQEDKPTTKSSVQTKKTSKKELASTISSSLEVSKKKSIEITEKILLTITDTLGKDEEVRIQGFGLFRNKIRKGRKYYIPGLQDSMEIKENKIPQFRPSNILINKIQNDEPVEVD